MFLKATILTLLFFPSITFPLTQRSVEEGSCRPLIRYSPKAEGLPQDIIKDFSPHSFYPNFTDNPAINHRMRRVMAKYLLPLNHPMKPILDSIFSKSRAIENKDTLKKAGFRIIFEQKRSFIIVAKHPKVPGYLFKIYTDSASIYKDGMVGWELFKTRCAVAKKIRNIIKRHKLRHFTVADKWLYPLPIEPKSRCANSEPVILMVKDMHIYPTKKSKRMWQTKATRKQLRQLYVVFKKGYGSAFLSNNVPYTKNGKCAFIDTEYKKRNITLWLVNRFLSKKMSHYWDRLVDKNMAPPTSSSNQ